MANKRNYKKNVKTAKRAVKTAKRHPVLTFILIVILLIGAVGYYYYEQQKRNLPTGDLSVHFLTLGNEYAGDCIYIRAGDSDIIVDAGSKPSSVTAIKSYLNGCAFDGTFEYAIITHAHEDHIAAFAGNSEYESLFELYDFGMIIDFPKTDSNTKTYQRYVEHRTEEIADGAKHYTALQCYNNEDGAQRSITVSENVYIDILYNYYYENKATTENEYSVCFTLRTGNKKFLFTGDLEKKGEEKLVQLNDIGEIDVYKAGHHGSKTSSSKTLLAEIKPKICVVTCVAGSSEYTTDNANTFPTQQFVNDVSNYTDQIYVTSLGSIDNKEYFTDMNGNVVITLKDGEISVNCSNNQTILKDTEWFKNNRELPLSWA